MENALLIAIIFSFSAVVIGRVVADGVVWLVEKIKKFFYIIFKKPLDK